MSETTISVGQLRQNPTRMLREVRAGARYTITDHGEPIAEVTAVRAHGWVPSADVAALLAELGADVQWAREIDDDRTADELHDPWDAER